jgi:threonine dehydratase
MQARLLGFTAVISDRPGALARLASIIGATGANIKDLAHDRIFSGPDVSRVRATCVVGTTGARHIEALQRAIREAGIDIVTGSPPG